MTLPRALRWSVVLATLLTSCATGVDRDLLLDVDRGLADGRPRDAAMVIAEQGQTAYGERNRLLYHMDLGLTLHLAGDYRASLRQLEKAEQLGSDLYTRSLSSEAGALFTNDLLIPYAGEEFERVLVNVFAALDYAILGEVDEALVEVRRIDAKLKNFRSHRKGRYRAEGFAQYLSGLLYEMSGALDDALIAYRAAWDTYQAESQSLGVSPPAELAQDIVLLARRTGNKVSAGIAGAAGNVKNLDQGAELVVLHYFGPGPRKIERVVEVSLSRGMAMAQALDVHNEDQKKLQQTLSVAKGMAFDNQVTVAYPVFEQPPVASHAARVSVHGCGSASSALVMNVSRLAEVSLADRMESALPRMFARALIKFVTARMAGKAAEGITDNAGIGLLVKMISQGAASATESADVRGWRTLPAAIHMTRLRCPAGRRRVYVEHLGGRRGKTDYAYDAELADGRKTFLLVATY